MLSHDLPLRPLQRPRLAQHCVGYADLADVVQPCRELQFPELVVRQSHSLADHPGESDDLIRVRARVVVAHFDRGCHRLNAGLDRPLELLAHPRLLERHGAEFGQPLQRLQLLTPESPSGMRGASGQGAQDDAVGRDRDGGPGP